ncbi:helix-turn-helix domain-containing protein [Leadbetterella sp. DM7]|uniref:helix-turn-helix domain-containing protein n=1 Tax=Leadbetterella sp. DM7 TaxID=3235085 RepID=UPI00349E7019
MNSKNHRTSFGKYLDHKSVNQAALARATGIRPNRISEFASKDCLKMRADEIYLLAKAMNEAPCHLLEYLYRDIKRPSRGMR